MAEPGGITQDMIDAFLRQNFGAAYQTLFGNQLAQNNPFAAFLKQKQGDYFNQYTGQVAGHPNWNYMNFLTGQGPDNAGNAVTGWGGVNPMNEWNNLAPQQRGERQPPAVRWMSAFGV